MILANILISHLSLLYKSDTHNLQFTHFRQLNKQPQIKTYKHVYKHNTIIDTHTHTHTYTQTQYIFTGVHQVHIQPQKKHASKVIILTISKVERKTIFFL